jgi:hypothetical protein
MVSVVNLKSEDVRQPGAAHAGTRRGAAVRWRAVPGLSDPFEPGRNAERVLARLELPDAAEELLAMVRFLTAGDGPLQQLATTGVSSPWHERVLLKAQERIEVLDRFLRGRVSFLVAGRDQGYGVFDDEVELAGGALDTCRAVSMVVERLLAGELPTDWEYTLMGDAAMRMIPLVEAL